LPEAPTLVANGEITDLADVVSLLLRNSPGTLSRMLETFSRLSLAVSVGSYITFRPNPSASFTSFFRAEGNLEKLLS